MGKPKPIPPETKAAVKLVALQIGVREAARQFKLSEEMVCKWSQREGWFKEAAPSESQEIAAQVIESVQDKAGVSMAVHTKPSNVIQSLKDKTKLAFAKGIMKGAKVVQSLQGEQVLDKSKKVLDLVTAHAKLHGEDSGGSQVAINLAFLRQ